VLEAVGSYLSFRDQLVGLYAKLSGLANLGSYEGFALDVSGNGRGAVTVEVVVIGQHVPLIELTFAFEIDRT
jgi:hypothetical protein